MNKNDYTIRLETEKDYRTVENIAREAFWNLNFPGCYEHYFVHVIRKHKDFIPQLDYVIEVDGRVIGCIMYAKGRLVDEKGNVKSIVTMGPLCILPEFQRKGYGKALLEYTFEVVKSLGYDVIVNLGNPCNYIPRGYKSCKKYNVCFEGGIFPAPLLVKVLNDKAFDGRKWIYYPSDVEKLCEDEKAVEEFDRLFPPKTKKWQLSQEEFYIHSHSVIRD